MNLKSIKPPICLPMEVKVRELNARLLLAFHLLNQGYPVLIGDRMGVYREMKYFNSPIFLSKGASSDYEYVFDAVKKCKGMSLVLFEEGAMNLRKGSEQELIRAFYPESVLHYIDVIFTYGDSFYETLNKFLPKSYTGDVVVSGNPRFDLHKPKYEKLFEEKVGNIKRTVGEFILFDTNFPVANSLSSLELITKQIDKIEEFSHGMKRRFLGNKDVQEKILNSWISMIKTVADTFKELKVVLRPHPAESDETYKKAFSGIENIIVTKEGEATIWIHAAKMLVHYDCTTGLEGFFSKKPILSYTPYKEEYDTFWLPMLISDTTTDAGELIEKISYYLDNANSFTLPDNSMKIFENEIINVKKYSVDLILEAIQKLVEKNNLDENASVSPSFRQRVVRFLHRVKDVPRQFVIKHVLNDDYYLKFPGLDKEEIIERLDKLKVIENLDFDYSVTQCGTNTFLLQKVSLF